ncbi:hypothetical protein OEA41_010712 [Lepraria neglecta]|uniref:Uncharacterized protein n=1 Tax=Lepraria neglecta TaxID=209136 RepID=A0AAD9YX40_9LECA|nr:hypothetical protein OEA41_010712 [Lepraria neglecta]
MIYMAFDDSPNSMHSAYFKQRQLLEPFTKLHSVRDFGDVGAINVQYVEETKVKTGRSVPYIEHILNNVIAMKLTGNNAFRRNKFLLAILIYQETVKEIFVSFWQWRPRATIRGGEFAGIGPRAAAILLQLQLQTAIVAVYLKNGDWENGLFWARETRTMRKIYADVAPIPRTDSTVYVKTVYREALALKQLDRLDLVVKFFKRNLDVSSADAPRDEELEELRAYISGDDIVNKDPADLENEMQANDRGSLRTVINATTV